MMKLLLLSVFTVLSIALNAQEYFTIRKYDVDVKINKDASLDISEKINVEFSEPRHGNATVIRNSQHRLTHC